MSGRIVKAIFQILPTFVDIDGTNYNLPLATVMMAQVLWRQREQWISAESLRQYLGCSDRMLRDHARDIDQVFIGYGLGVQTMRRPYSYKLSANAPEERPRDPNTNQFVERPHGLMTALNVYETRQYETLTPRERKLVTDAFNAGRIYGESLQ